MGKIERKKSGDLGVRGHWTIKSQYEIKTCLDLLVESSFIEITMQYFIGLVRG